jgi:hypothetical protein
VDDKLDNIPMWKEAVVAYFKAMYRHLPEGTEEIMLLQASGIQVGSECK